MIHHYGPATWFLTLSPSEWLWTELIEYLREVNGPSVAKMSPNELIASDPVSTARFIDNAFHAMLDFICSPDNPIGKVTHYFWRREYQSRGSQHFHLLIWIEDAPIIDKSSEEDVAAFAKMFRIVSPTTYPKIIEIGEETPVLYNYHVDFRVLWIHGGLEVVGRRGDLL